MPMHRRLYSFGYRKLNPELFPEVCGPCNRRFRLPADLQNHNSALLIHGPRKARKRRNIYQERKKSPSRNISLFDTIMGLPLHASASNISGMFDVPIENFPRFVQDNVELNSSCSTLYGRVVNMVCSYIRNEFPEDLKPEEVLKAGSLGKGTAVKGKSDVDLIVCLAGPRYNSIRKCANSLRVILQKMRRELSKCNHCKILDWNDPWVAKLQVNCGGHTHDIDVLPTYNVLDHSTKSSIYKAMSGVDRDIQQNYSAPLAPLQIKFVSERPTKLKMLIRVVKYWKMTYVEGKTMYRAPTSYPLELICISEWMDARQPQNFNLRKGFYCVLRALKNYGRIRRVWTENYSRDLVPRDLTSSYYVIDPANPFNNVMAKFQSWDEVACFASSCLQKPLFRDLNGELSDWI